MKCRDLPFRNPRMMPAYAESEAAPGVLSRSMSIDCTSVFSFLASSGLRSRLCTPLSGSMLYQTNPSWRFAGLTIPRSSTGRLAAYHKRRVSEIWPEEVEVSGGLVESSLHERASIPAAAKSNRTFVRDAIIVTAP